MGLRLADLLRIDINNPAISEDGREYVVAAASEYGCDTAVSPLIMWMFIIAIILFIAFRVVVRRNRKTDIRDWFIFFSALCLIVFCVILRWEPYVGRYMISYLALCTVLVACVGDICESYWNQNLNRNKVGLCARSIVLFLAGIEIFNLLGYQLKIVTQQLQAPDSNWGYFWDHSSAYDEYHEITEYMNTLDAKEVGLNMADGLFEYPFYPMLEDAEVIRRIMTNNDSTKYERKDFIPDIILYYAMAFPEDENQVVYNGCTYSLTYKTDRWGVYSK